MPTPSLAAGALPAGAVDEGAPADTSAASIQVVLGPSDPAALQSLLASLYDPASPGYHHWLTSRQFAVRFGPASSTVAETVRWLRSRGLTARSTSTFAVSVQASARSVDRALGTTFHRYRTKSGASGITSLGPPLIPSGLQGRVVAINGLSSTKLTPTGYPTSERPRTGSSGAAAGASVQACQTAVNGAQANHWYTLDQVGQDYGVSNLLQDGLTGAQETVAVFELASYSPTDIAAYQQCFGLSNPYSSVTVGSAPKVNRNGTFEADLDMEQVMTQAPGAAVVAYQTSQDNLSTAETNIYDTWSKIVTDDTASVVSTSWAECEPDAAANHELTEFHGGLPVLFQEAAAQGQTVVAAAGDSGSEACAPDYPNGAYSALAVSYPASDQNVTAVGGTDYNGVGNETVWNDCGGTNSSTAFTCAENDNFQAAGGGGESTNVSRPSWQTNFSNDPCPSCRAVPDLSANSGIPMEVYWEGPSSGQAGWWGGVGTSFAAPFVAGLMADRNQGCGAPTGNLAPYIYGLAGTASGYAAGLYDVTSGNNDMFAAHDGSYAATTGYDLASGLGTPDAVGLTCPEVTSVTPPGQTGGPGQTVTVSGLGLENAVIEFDGVPAQVVHSTATSAVVDLPPGHDNAVVSAQPASCPLANAAACQGTQSATYAYLGAPPPTTTTTTTTTTVAPTTTTVAPTTTTTTAAPPVCASAPGRSLDGAAGIAAVDIAGCDGYFVVDGQGTVAAFGSARSHGDLSGLRLSAPIIAIQATPDGQGYWLLGADGGVFTFGDARFFGSTGGIRLNAPVVGMAVTPDNTGYWVVAKDGGVFSFGAARFYGSTGNLRLAAPVDGIAVAPGGQGYWLVASDGGVFTFTSDGFYGSLGGVPLVKPIVGMSSTFDGRGYTLVGSDGGVFTFGDAPFYGSLGEHPPATPVVDLSPAPHNNGYYLVAAAGDVYAFGPGARFFGNA